MRISGVMVVKKNPGMYSPDSKVNKELQFPNDTSWRHPPVNKTANEA